MSPGDRSVPTVTRRHLSVLLVLLHALIASVTVARSEESPPPFDSRVVFRVSLLSSQREFHIGEVIPIKLSFSSHLKDRFQVDEASYDRSGRMNYEHFHVRPAEGAADPIPADGLSLIGGGLTNFIYLNPKPWSIRLNLNEWITFKVPGEYRVTVSSERISRKTPAGPSGSAEATVRSNPITLKIVAADCDWQKRTFDQAVAVINANPGEERRVYDEPPSPKEKAWDVLRYLGTPEAASELATRLRGDDSDNHDFICYMGLICSPARAAGRDALIRELADPDHPINETFLDTLRRAEPEHHLDQYTEEGQRKQNEELAKEFQKLLAALSNKRGRALAVSLSTAVDDAWTLKVTRGTLDELVSQLVAVFDQLPSSEQSILLNYRWETIAGPPMLPIVKRYAQLSAKALEERGANQPDTRDILTSALKHWLELEPVEARSYIIKEITEPAPRIDATALGILPDATLPEVDAPLAQHFAMHASGDEPNSFVASLIARYATPAILPQILKESDPFIGKWSCATQTAILAYALRSDPEAARSRLERAVAAHGKGWTGCYRRVLGEVAEMQYRPVLEDIAIHALDDPNEEIAADAATTLGKFGSPKAEAALLARYEKWRRQSASYGPERFFTSADYAEDLHGASSDPVGLGTTFLDALATGQDWLTDTKKLRHLMAISRFPSIRRDLQKYLGRWNQKPLTINFSVDPISFSGHVAQYDLNSADALEEKLSQFPTGTEFTISTTNNSAANREYLTRLRTFLTNRGMVIKEENPVPKT
jgi:hypothetical protein